MPRQATNSKPASAPEKPRSVVLSPGRMGLKEHRMNTWAVTAPAGATQDDVVKQDFWSLISDKLRPYDEIDVIANDATWLMKLKVLSCDRTWAHVHTLHTYELEPAGQPEKSLRFRVEHRGPESKWSVIRNSDGSVISEGLDTMAIANQIMQDHDRRR